LECKKQWTDENGQKHTKKGCVDGVEDCCGRRILELQPDFREQKGMVEEEVTRCGHLVMFYPKFHCELNWIEYFWGDGKRRTRLYFQWIEEDGARGVGEYEEVRILRWSKKSERIVRAYRDGLEYGSKEFQKAYKSHRRIRAREIDR
jgi:transposase